MSHLEQLISYYDLDKWLNESFDSQEKQLISDSYQPLILSNGPSHDGTILSTSMSKLAFLSDLSMFFNKPGLFEIAIKIQKKAEELIDSNPDILDVHYFLQNKLELYYRIRDILPDALEISKQTCKEQISIADDVKQAMIKKYGHPLPSHKGYKQLAIIYEKDKEYNEAISLCEEASMQGWTGDWQKRIDRVKRKLQKI